MPCICHKVLYPIFGNLGDKKPTCCKSCKDDDMIDIKNKKCMCKKSQPSYGYPDKTPRPIDIYVISPIHTMMEKCMSCLPIGFHRERKNVK